MRRLVTPPLLRLVSRPFRARSVPYFVASMPHLSSIRRTLDIANRTGRNVVSEPSSVKPPYDCSTPCVAPVSPPIPLLRCTGDRRHHPYRSSHPASDADCRKRDNDPISIVAPPPRLATRNAPALCPIVIPRLGNNDVDRSYPSSYSTCESDHGETSYEPDSAAVPRAQAVTSPSTPAVVYAIPVRRERMSEVEIESQVSRAAARTFRKRSEEI